MNLLKKEGFLLSSFTGQFCFIEKHSKFELITIRKLLKKEAKGV
jgi:hypothetical protein